ncbi:hypothetical protein Leryth_017492 [Lithospermum erythrorhizon]|nr:hypothetical protein Leryth_017492 [Lithospermum erythrorhizon]
MAIRIITGEVYVVENCTKIYRNFLPLSFIVSYQSTECPNANLISTVRIPIKGMKCVNIVSSLLYLRKCLAQTKDTGSSQLIQKKISDVYCSLQIDHPSNLIWTVKNFSNGNVRKQDGLSSHAITEQKSIIMFCIPLI